MRTGAGRRPSAARARRPACGIRGRPAISAGTSRRCSIRAGSRCGSLMCCRAMCMTWPRPGRMSWACCGRSWTPCRCWPIPGYEGAGHGVHVPVKKPAGVRELDIGTRARNALIRSVRCLGERGFALLTQRWKTLQHVTASPGRIGLIARAALVLVLFEHKPRVPWGRRDGVKIPGAAGLRLAGVPGGLAGVSALIGRGRRWKMRWCGRPLTSNHHGGPGPGHKPDAGSCPEGCELALRARGPDFRLPSAPAGGRDRLPHPHDGRP